MITIVDYGMGNLGSIQNMLKKIGVKSEISSAIAEIESAEKIILPGVGSFDKAISNLQTLGLFDIIHIKAKAGIPLLGICLGMQILGDGSEEGVLPGLGLIPGRVKKFSNVSNIKVPHMGWNQVHYSTDSPLFNGFEHFEETRFYFVHSYHYVCDDPGQIIGQSKYGSNFTSAVGNSNVYGVQFHPEKSHKFGMLLLKNFIERC